MKTDKAVAIGVASLNLMLFAIFAVVAFVNEINPIVSTLLVTVAYTILCFDMLYAALCGRLSFTRMIISAAAVCAVLAFGILSGLSDFINSFNIVGYIILECAYVVNAVIIFYGIFYKTAENCEKSCKLKVLSSISAIVGTCGLISMLTVGIVFMCASTYANTNAVNITTVMISLCVLSAAFVIYGVKNTKSNRILSTVAVIACALSVIPYAVIEGFAYSDVKNADISFEQAFGYTEFQAGLHSPYNFALEFIGVETNNYTVEKNKVYFEGEKSEEGIVLRYDAYYPDEESKGVLINLHGSGGDKDKGNYAHRNKYFASVGYTVFDIQYGDWNESGTGDIPFYDTTLEWAVSHLYHLDEFIKYASITEKTADWSNTFLTGVSMGGTQISRYSLSYDNSIAETGAVLRGIIPIYPGYSFDDEGILNCLSYVTKSSAPCLVFMGDKDVVVDPVGARRYKDAYSDAGNSLCASIYISYAGHGCDYFMAGRSNQMITYYMHKFMEIYRQ